MKILALDTATENCSAALLIDGHLHCSEIETERGHSAQILPMVDDLLAATKIALSDLDAIAFGRGPGSFTGVRLAATVTQGLAFGAGLSVVPISDLQATAQRAFNTDAALSRLLVCNDARMSEVYWACFEKGEDNLAKLVGEEHVSKPAQVTLPPTWSTAAAVGRGFIAYAEALRLALPGVVIPEALAAPSQSRETIAAARAARAVATAPAPHLLGELLGFLPRAPEIAVLAVPLIKTGQLLPPEAALPVYLRDNVTQPPKAPR